MISNRHLNSLLIFIMLYMTSGCGSSNETEASTPTISLSENSIETGYEGGTEIIYVNTDREWTAFSDEDWIRCQTNGNSSTEGTVEITVGENNTYQSRKGNVTVKAGATRASIAVSQEAKPEPDTSGIDTPEGYRLVWNDEFEKGSSPDLNLWYYETGATGWGNNEIQRYIAGSQDGVTCAETSNGTLKITARKVGSEVYSIRMNTKENWLYGYFEARMKLPKGKGTWPAFWMLPETFQNWPDDGEIDIMEEVGYDPNVIHSTIHCKTYNHMANTQKSGQKTVPDAQDEFHVYAVEWTDSYIKGFVDGECYFTFENDGKGNKDTWPFNTPFYLKLNLAWGGNWGGAQGIDESALPATFEIDYVRVFQKK